jgi:hypothetical protein
MESLRKPRQTADRLAIQSQAGAYEVRLRNESFHPVVGLAFVAVAVIAKPGTKMLMHLERADR